MSPAFQLQPRFGWVLDESEHWVSQAALCVAPSKSGAPAPPTMVHCAVFGAVLGLGAFDAGSAGCATPVEDAAAPAGGVCWGPGGEFDSYVGSQGGDSS